jgi:LuxR family transcriptional regulator, maltose regulon positive regulatory protein
MGAADTCTACRYHGMAQRRATDDNPAVFWDAVLRAVASAGAIPEGHRLSSASLSAGATDSVLQTLFGGLEALPHPLLIVLDDFQVIGDPDILEPLAELIAHDTSVRLMVLTRSDPPFPLHRLRLSGDLAEIGAADLAFDAAAVTSLARDAESLELIPIQVDRLLERTEGWPAGVRLATMYMSRNRADRDLAGFAGTDTSVAEFLVAEVLQRQDSGARDFLLRTSVADQVTGDLADAIVPGGNGLARLEMIERASHFVVCVDAERTTYRYHPLLRELLLHSLRRDDPAGYRNAHRAAARWMSNHGDPVRGLHHATAAEDWGLAVDIFIDASASIVGVHRFAVRDQLRAIPYETLPPSASLQLCAAGAALIAGHFDAVQVHVDAARRLVGPSGALPPAGAAFLENPAGAAARIRGDLPTVIATSDTALEHLAKALPGPATEGHHTIAVTQHAVGLLWAGEISEARDGFTAITNESHPGDVALTVISARANLALCDLIAGQIDEAESAAHNLIKEASMKGWTSLLQVRPAHLVLATIHLLRGDAIEADRAVAAGLAAQVGGVELWPTVALHLIQASIAVSRHRPRAAVAAMTNALSTKGDLPVPRSLVDLMSRAMTDVALLTADPYPIPTQEAGQLPHTPTSWSSLARLNLARSELCAAHDAAERVPRPPESDHLADTLAAIEAWLVLALVADKRGRHRAALQAIRSAAELARPQRLVWPFLVTGSDRIAFYLQRLVAAAAPDRFVRVVLAGLKQQDLNLPEPEPLIEPLTERELAVLAELSTMKTNSEIASEFFLSPNTVKAHVQRLFRKLEVSSRREAVRRGRELGLIT